MDKQESDDDHRAMRSCASLLKTLSRDALGKTSARSKPVKRAMTARAGAESGERCGMPRFMSAWTVQTRSEIYSERAPRASIDRKAVRIRQRAETPSRPESSAMKAGRSRQSIAARCWGRRLTAGSVFLTPLHAGIGCTAGEAVLLRGRPRRGFAPDHPLRPIREVVKAALSQSDPSFAQLYVRRPVLGFAGAVLRASPLQLFYPFGASADGAGGVCHLFRWFVGLGVVPGPASSGIADQSTKAWSKDT